MKAEIVRLLAHEGLDRSKETTWLDGTLGLGGHAEALLDAAGEKARLKGIDKDAAARALAAKRLERFGKRVEILAGGFEDMGRLAAEGGFDGVVLDLGISSLQLDSAERGFSFQREAPLDMRLDPGSGIPAWEWLGTQDEGSLKKVFREYGEEPRAGALARSVLRAAPKTTLELAEAVMKVKGGPRKGQAHPATQVFQAVRIAVNRELEAIEAALPSSLPLLKQGGRLAVISFHSLEDRRVKVFIAGESIDCICPPGLPICVCGHKAKLKKVTKKALRPEETEVVMNPRSRSAKLRVAEKL